MINNNDLIGPLGFGAHMKQVRKEKGISQFKLAEMTGLSVCCISNTEQGNSRPRVMTAAIIARQLGFQIKKESLAWGK